MHNKLLIAGASGHGKVIADLARCLGLYEEIAFVDDNEELLHRGFTVGKIVYAVEHKDEYDVIVAIGNAAIRKKIQEMYEDAGVNLVTLVHPTAYVAQDVELGNGTVVMAGAVIQTEACVGKGVIVNTGATVDHECEISDYVHIAVGATIAGDVKVGQRSWLGAGATVIQGINICEDVMIGAGAVVVSDIQEAGTYIGIPAKRMEKRA